VSGFKIGNIDIKNRAVLAPMAGVTNPAFRLIAKEFGAGLVCAEMVSDKGILLENARTLRMLYVDEREKPLSLQIFGGSKDTLVRAAQYVDQNTNADIIDINMGCPVPKVTKCEAGAKWLLDPDKVYEMETIFIFSTMFGRLNPEERRRLRFMVVRGLNNMKEPQTGIGLAKPRRLRRFRLSVTAISRHLKKQNMRLITMVSMPS